MPLSNLNCSGAAATDDMSACSTCFEQLFTKETAERIKQQKDREQPYQFNCEHKPDYLLPKTASEVTNNPSFIASCLAVTVASSLDICREYTCICQTLKR
ncbi:hypothetical protein V6N12_034850 [Hibiscus sabdariffa]|uniref:Uncharacterized protein n=1 Tax=Hibiscus sabdariffa TaxID=183260 RepID=A0ABR2BNN5_9ROSI